jgi:hypothetical protein
VFVDDVFYYRAAFGESERPIGDYWSGTQGAERLERGRRIDWITLVKFELVRD